jgi:hypothetical protein
MFNVEIKKILQFYLNTQEFRNIYGLYKILTFIVPVTK